MTKKLEETFNLSATKHEVTEIKKEIAKDKAKTIISTDDLDDHDTKMDEYATESFSYAKEVYEVGMGVEARHAAEMFNAAANFMKVAMDAKNNKLEKRLKLYDLELKRQKMDNDRKKSYDGVIDGDDDSIMANREDIFDDD